ncbi:hypothetical protein CHX27_00030 [Flavobacterium aurantiibacter]|uniref:Uncharacterized protein n=2 Tax=Flavobacterium aurantiibacter TaxID=2023067 RepID=A0A256AFW9_9FLAO|nr:hypothetical protein CHX27_00030 [Flavobacterium aurantiibacter]
MDEKKFNELKAESKNGVIEHSIAIKKENSTGISKLASTPKNMLLFNKISNHIIKTLNEHFYKKDPSSDLARGRVETSSLMLGLATSSDAAALSIDTYGEHERYGNNQSLITMNFDLRNDLNTAPNIFSLFEHEFHGHGGGAKLKIDVDRTNQSFKFYEHKAIYEMQQNTPNFKYASGDYRANIVKKNKEYGN